MQEGQSKTLCALCQSPSSHFKITQGEHFFCCYGCHTVFNILQSMSGVENYQDQPIFKQAVKFGLISNPHLLEQLQRKSAEEDEDIRKWHIEIGDMWCPSCAELIKLILQKIKGIAKCVVDYATDLAAIEFSPKVISKDEIKAVIESLGYSVKEFSGTDQQISLSLYVRFGLAAFCSLNVMMFAYPLYATYFSFDSSSYGQLFAWLSLIFSIPVATYCAYPIFRRCYTGLKAGIFGMEALVCTGVVSSFALSLYELMHGSNLIYLDSMTAIIVFVLLGKMIESKAKLTTKNILLRLTQAIPKRGRKLLGNGEEAFYPIKEIAKGDCLVALSGEKVVLDGIVEEGEGAVDESLMTGESVPVFKRKGARVLSGTLMQSGRLVYKITASAEETALSRIIGMVDQDIGFKSAYVRKIDRIAKLFTPAAFLIALTAALLSYFLGVMDPGKTAFQTACLKAIAILLISCPCAIGIAAPLAESNLISAVAGLGAIIRNRAVLHYLGKETVYVFDKTGTITEGKFKVSSGLETLPLGQLAALKSLASCSAHPISNAIASAIHPPKLSCSIIEEIPGKGIRGMISGKNYLLGSCRFFQEEGIALSQCASAHTQVHFAENGIHLASLSLGDTVKEEARRLLSMMRGKRCILLSGDSQAAVDKLGTELGFEECIGGVTPLEKRSYIEKLKKEGHIVFMAGDGINDAPAITSAQIGASVVSAADISIQVSDLLLTTDKLSIIPSISALAYKTHKIVRQNFFWSFFYNLIGIVLAAFGFLSPLFSAFAMIVSSLIVLFNSKRITLPKG